MTGALNITVLVLIATGLLFLGISLIRGRVKSVPEVNQSDFDVALVFTIRSQVAPFIVSGELLPTRPEYVFYKFYTYSRAVLNAIVGVGIAPPILTYLNGIGNKAVEAGASATSNVAIQHVSVPIEGPWFLRYAAIAAAVIIVAMAVYVSQSALDKRAILADSCAVEMRRMYTRLLQVTTTDPLGKFFDGIANEVATIVQRHVAEKSWTWPEIVAPGIESRVEAMTNEILAKLRK